MTPAGFVHNLLRSFVRQQSLCCSRIFSWRGAARNLAQSSCDGKEPRAERACPQGEACGPLHRDIAGGLWEVSAWDLASFRALATRVLSLSLNNSATKYTAPESKLRWLRNRGLSGLARIVRLAGRCVGISLLIT